MCAAEQQPAALAVQSPGSTLWIYAYQRFAFTTGDLLHVAPRPFGADVHLFPLATGDLLRGL